MMHNSTMAADVFTQREWFIAGTSFAIGVAICLFIVLMVVLLRQCLKCRCSKLKSVTSIAKRNRGRNSSCVFISEKPLSQDVGGGPQNNSRKSTVDNTQNSNTNLNYSASLQNPVNGRDSDYSLANFKRHHSEDAMCFTIGDAFNEKITTDKSPGTEQPLNSIPDPARVVSEHSADDYQSSNQNMTDYQFPRSSVGDYQSPNQNAPDYQFPRSVVGDYQSPNQNASDYQFPRSNVGNYQSPNQTMADYQFPRYNVGDHQSPSPNVARVRPTFLEIKEQYSPDDDKFTPICEAKVDESKLKSTPTLVTEEKGIQTDPIDTQRESLLSGYSRPKETGERRKVHQNTDDDYDYASFINLIKHAVHNSLREDDAFALHRTKSADHCLQKNQFTFPANNESNPVVRSYSYKHSRRPPERLPMPLKKQSNSIEYEQDEISYFRKLNASSEISQSYEGNSDSTISPPYIDPMHLNPRVKQDQEDSEDSEDDMMTMDDDFKDYVSTLKKQKPPEKGGLKTKKCDTDRKGGSGQITVQIRRDKKQSEGRSTSSYICIEINDNILSHLVHRGEKVKSSDGEDNDDSNEDYLQMSNDPVYGNVGQDDDYLSMENIEKADEVDSDPYLRMDGVPELDADDKECTNTDHFYLKITG